MNKKIARSKNLAAGVLVAAATLFASLTQAQTPPASGQAGAGAPRRQMVMETTAFEDGGVIPNKYTELAGTAAVSPAITWTQLPTGTQSLVLLMRDPEAAMKKSPKIDVTHWLLWNIPATSTGLHEGFAAGDQADGTRQISQESNAYRPPGAPAGRYHHYTFELYALDTKIDVPSGQPAQVAETRTAVFDAMEGHVLGKSLLVGRFHK